MDIELTRTMIHCGTLIGLTLEAVAQNMIAVDRTSETVVAARACSLFMTWIVHSLIGQSVKNLSKKYYITHLLYYVRSYIISYAVS